MIGYLGLGLRQHIGTQVDTADDEAPAGVVVEEAACSTWNIDNPVPLAETAKHVLDNDLFEYPFWGLLALGVVAGGYRAVVFTRPTLGWSHGDWGPSRRVANVLH
jgi:hypothetical protein